MRRCTMMQRASFGEETERVLFDCVKWMPWRRQAFRHGNLGVAQNVLRRETPKVLGAAT